MSPLFFFFHAPTLILIFHWPWISTATSLSFSECVSLILPRGKITQHKYCICHFYNRTLSPHKHTQRERDRHTHTHRHTPTDAIMYAGTDPRGTRLDLKSNSLLLEKCFHQISDLRQILLLPGVEAKACNCVDNKRRESIQQYRDDKASYECHISTTFSGVWTNRCQHLAFSPETRCSTRLQWRTLCLMQCPTHPLTHTVQTHPHTVTTNPQSIQMSCENGTHPQQIYHLTFKK